MDCVSSIHRILFLFFFNLVEEEKMEKILLCEVSGIIDENSSGWAGKENSKWIFCYFYCLKCFDILHHCFRNVSYHFLSDLLMTDRNAVPSREALAHSTVMAEASTDTQLPVPFWAPRTDELNVVYPKINFFLFLNDLMFTQIKIKILISQSQKSMWGFLFPLIPSNLPRIQR